MIHQQISGKEAFKSGWKLAQGNLRKSLRLGGTNFLVLGLVSLVLLIPTGAFGIGAVVSSINEGFNFMNFIPTLAIFVLTLPLVKFATILGVVFKATTWEYAYLSLIQDKKEEK